MSTRSIIAKQHGDSWKGRYAHWDGYPSHQGNSIWEIVRRDGVEQSIKTLVDDNFYWSLLNPVQEEGINERSSLTNIKGYGVAANEAQSDPDEWYTPINYKESWCDYVYVISQGGLLVIRIYDDVHHFFRWDDLEPNWVNVQDAAGSAV
jgi:hypothetical protein